MHADLLTSSAQHDLLSTINWPALLVRPGLSVIIHDQPPPAQDDLLRSTPLNGDHPDCYEEMMVHSVLVESATFSSRSVRVMLIAKSWSGANAGPATYSGMATEDVTLGGQDIPAIRASLGNAFIGAVRKTAIASTFKHQSK